MVESARLDPLRSRPKRVLGSRPSTETDVANDGDCDGARQLLLLNHDMLEPVSRVDFALMRTIGAG